MGHEVSRVPWRACAPPHFLNVLLSLCSPTTFLSFHRFRSVGLRSDRSLSILFHYEDFVISGGMMRELQNTGIGRIFIVVDF